MADSSNFFTLFESSAGYALLEVVAIEEINPTDKANQKTITDLSLFSRAVKLKAFQPFASAEDALENANAISEHAMTDSLKSFLEMNLPKSSKKKKEGKASAFVLGVIDSGLATAISEGVPGIAVRSDDTVREIARGARLHLTSLIKGLDNGGIEQAQLGLGHSYSRGKVKFNPARSDNMIIQSIALLDQMDKDLNTFAMRVREWYSWHFPELKDLVKDNYMFARCAAYIQDKKSLFPKAKTSDDDDDEDMEDANGDNEDKIPGLTEIVGEEELVNSIIAAAKSSMGMDCSAVDMINIINFTQRMVKLAEFRKQLALYLTDKMAIVAPNLSTLIGDTVAARLISKAGSLTNLAKAPASTVQILGAEKALFRALKTKGNTPKYGLIYNSTFIGRAGAKNKGRISRYLANKCSIATRIDSFSDEPSSIYGEKLREQVEERLKFYETGAAPRKNIDIMEEIRKNLDAANGDDDEVMETPKKKKSKKEKKKRKRDSDDDDDEEVEVDKEEKKSAKKSKKSKEVEAATPEKAPKTPKSEKKSAKKAKTPKSEKKSAKKKKSKSKD
jgi:nucleolar protein 56